MKTKFLTHNLINWVLKNPEFCLQQLVNIDYQDLLTRKNKNGNTVLHYIAHHRPELFVDYLKIGADPFARNMFGDVPLTWLLMSNARENCEFIEAVNALNNKQKKKLKNTCCNQNRNILWKSLYSCIGQDAMLKVIQCLLQNNPELIRQVDVYRDTILGRLVNLFHWNPSSTNNILNLFLPYSDKNLLTHQNNKGQDFLTIVHSHQFPISETNSRMIEKIFLQQNNSMTLKVKTL